MRVLKLKIYFNGSAHPWTFEDVTNMTTEGGLLRITQSNTYNQWFPLCAIFRIVEEGREEVVIARPRLKKDDKAKETPVQSNP